MENPYNNNSYQPYTPEPNSSPAAPSYDGNNTMASLSLVFGLLALLSLCCVPPALCIFSGLSILFACLSRGEHKLSSPAKAGMAISVSALVLITTLIITVCTLFLTTDRGRSFLEDYTSLLFSENPTEEEIYDFLDEYLPEEGTPFYSDQPYSAPDTSDEGNYI